MALKAQSLGSFAWKAIFCTRKPRNETFINGKIYDGFFFLKKLCMREQTFLGRICWRDVLQGGIMIRSCKGGEKVPQIHFPVI